MLQHPYDSVAQSGVDKFSKAYGEVKPEELLEAQRDVYEFMEEKGKDSITVSIFKKDCKTHGGNPKNIHSVCYDMSPAFISGIHTEFPDAAITNGILKRTNSVIQLLKRGACGYRNVQNFITMIYLRLGQLNFQLPT